MRIGLIGAPGAGKSDVAHGLAKVLWDPITVIDEYVEALEDSIDLKLGFDATYIGNLHVALCRESLERQAEYASPGFITCGTTYETACYSAMAFEAEFEVTPSAEEEQQVFRLRLEAMMQILAALYMDLFRYDYLFYLPTKSADPQVQDLDKLIQASFAAFKLNDVHVINSDNPVEEIEAIIPKNPLMAAKMEAQGEN